MRKFKRRGTLEIIYEILEYIDPARPISKIATYIGINYKELTKYLKTLVDTGMITNTKENRIRLIARTDKASKLLNCFHEIQVLLDFNPLIVK